MHLQSPDILFIDIQTTGPKPGTSNMLEFAWSLNSSETPMAYLIQQPDLTPIPRRIQILTGITNDLMTNAISKQELWSALCLHLGDLTADGKSYFCVIHFSQFEKPFLHDFTSQFNVNEPFKIFCTHEIAKRLLPNLPTRGIKGLAGYFGHHAGDVKRASAYVLATKTIWKNLTGLLAEQNIHTFEELSTWLELTPKKSRIKYEYPLPKEKRLLLPSQPGIYRMLSQWGQVLYVGKATNLRDRVNSYFRGQRNRDPRKLEMLAQVWDLRVTTVGSPIEAALLETDEIKRLDPPYNISLKSGHRQLVFFNKDFTSKQSYLDTEHPIGPFSNTLNFDSLLALRDCLQQGCYSDSIFFDPFEPKLIEEGFTLFCVQNSLNPQVMKSIRIMLAVGIKLYRKTKESNLDETTVDNSNEAEDSQLLIEESASAEKENDLISAQDLADKFQRHFVRAGKCYLRAKLIKKLMNAEICFEGYRQENEFALSKQTIKTHKGLRISIRQGLINFDTRMDNVDQVEKVKGPSDLEFNIESYDRMTVLLMELAKLSRTQKYSVRYR